jgi:hypothetical protein
MDKNQKVNLAKAKKVKADELKRERQADEARRADTLEAFVRQLSDVVESGIDLNGLESLDVACDRVEKFSDTIKSSLTDIAKYVDHFYELELPEELIYKQVADPILLEKLEALGDNGELYSRLAKLDEALVLLAVAVEKAQKHGKRPEDYLPVRIVDGFDDQLRFVTIFSTGGGGGGGGNGSPYIDSTGKIVNVELTAGGEIPVSATLASSPEYIKLAGSDANERDSTYYGDGITSGVMAVHERYFDGSAYNRTPASKVLVDKATTNIIYIGKAPIGTALGTGAWQIKKIDKTVTDNVTITFAAAGAFTATWNNRGSETYS